MNKILSYSIKEASQLCGLPESTLRYYETIGIIKPIDRNPSSGHRVFSEDDINLIIGVACLNATGMSIEDMKVYLENVSGGNRYARDQIKLLETQKKCLAEEERSLKLRRRYVDIKIEYWNAATENNKKGMEEAKQKAQKMTKEINPTKE